MAIAQLEETQALLAPAPSDLPICDVTFSDLEPLVTIRRNNESSKSRTAARNYRPNAGSLNAQTSTSDVPVPQVSTVQALARRIQSVVHSAHERGSSVGLSRLNRYTGDGSAESTTGNAANAKAAATKRASSVRALKSR